MVDFTSERVGVAAGAGGITWLLVNGGFTTALEALRNSLPGKADYAITASGKVINPTHIAINQIGRLDFLRALLRSYLPIIIGVIVFAKFDNWFGSSDDVPSQTKEHKGLKPPKGKWWW